MASPRDPLAIVEAAYELQGSETQWLEGVLRAAQPMLDQGEGVMAFVLDLGAAPGHMVRSPVVLGGRDDWEHRWRAEWWEKVVLPMPHDLLVAASSFGPAYYTSHAVDALSRELPTLELYVRDLADRGYRSGWNSDGSTSADRENGGLEVPDLFNVQGTDPSGHGIVLLANHAALASRPPARAALRSWSRIVAHLTAAHRVRRKLGESGGIVGAEAVMAPGGKIVHAEGAAESPEARDALRQAAIDVDRARTSQVRGTDEALELWRALHDGRWSVLESFDADGRRFLVARENEPASDPAPTLSRREQQVVDLLSLGHSNKLIAYDLGISVSSVATHIRRAAAKLGLDGTRQLVRWSRARPRPRET